MSEVGSKSKQRYQQAPKQHVGSSIHVENTRFRDCKRFANIVLRSISDVITCSTSL